MSSSDLVPPALDNASLVDLSLSISSNTLNLSRVLHDPEALEGGRGRSQLGLLPVDVEDTAFVLGENSCDDADDAVGIGVVAGPNAGDARIGHVGVRL